MKTDGQFSFQIRKYISDVVTIRTSMGLCLVRMLWHAAERTFVNIYWTSDFANFESNDAKKSHKAKKQVLSRGTYDFEK